MTISYSDFKQLSREQQKDALEALRKEPGISELIKIWGVSRSKLYKMIHELELAVSSKGKRSKSNKNASAQKSLKKTMDLQTEQYVPMEPKPNVFAISLNAEGSFKTVSEKLKFLFQQNIVPDTTVRVSLSIEEI